MPRRPRGPAAGTGLADLDLGRCRRGHVHADFPADGGPCLFRLVADDRRLDCRPLQSEIRHVLCLRNEPFGQGDADLRCLLGGCDLFAYVPEIEGFGLPVAEALACGAPVVTSSVSSLPEVVGDAAELVDPFDDSAIASGMARVLDQPQLRTLRRPLGLERAARLSVGALAAATLSAYHEAVGR